jgi:hypothetical protein
VARALTLLGLCHSLSDAHELHRTGAKGRYSKCPSNQDTLLAAWPVDVIAISLMDRAPSSEQCSSLAAWGAAGFHKGDFRELRG